MDDQLTKEIEMNIQQGAGFRALLETKTKAQLKAMGAAGKTKAAMVDGLMAQGFPRQCEHGLSTDLCAGPQHYDYDEDEQRAYGW